MKRGRTGAGRIPSGELTVSPESGGNTRTEIEAIVSVSRVKFRDAIVCVCHGVL